MITVSNIFFKYLYRKAVRSFRMLLPTLAVSGSMLLATGCSEEMMEYPEIAEKITICFTIHNPQSVTRSDGDSGSSLVSESEIYDYRFYLLDTDGGVVAQLPASTQLEKDEANGDDAYKVIANIEKEQIEKLLQGSADSSNLPLKILMLANWPTSLTYPSVEAAKIDYTDIATVEFNSFGTNNSIPMYGLLSATIDVSIGSTADEPITLPDTLWLLRAMAKIEVSHSNLIGSSLFGNGVIKGVSVSLVNSPMSGLIGPYDYMADTRGWLPPDDLTPFNDPKETHLPATLSISSTPSAFYQSDRIDGGKSHTIYTFETEMEGLAFYEHETSTSKRPTIRMDLTVEFTRYDWSPDGPVEVKWSEVHPYYLQFADYDESGKALANKAWPRLLRNTVYNFEIQKIGESFGVTTDVIPYDIISLEPEFGLKPKDSNP